MYPAAAAGIGFAALPSSGRGFLAVYQLQPAGFASYGRHAEVDAHHGAVRDLAFVRMQEELLLVSCGDDGEVCVWDARKGTQVATQLRRGECTAVGCCRVASASRPG